MPQDCQQLQSCPALRGALPICPWPWDFGQGTSGLITCPSSWGSSPPEQDFALSPAPYRQSFAPCFTEANPVFSLRYESPDTQRQFSQTCLPDSARTFPFLAVCSLHLLYAHRVLLFHPRPSAGDSNRRLLTLHHCLHYTTSSCTILSGETSYGTAVKDDGGNNLGTYTGSEGLQGKLLPVIGAGVPRLFAHSYSVTVIATHRKTFPVPTRQQGEDPTVPWNMTKSY